MGQAKIKAMKEKAEAAVLGAKQNEADAFSDAELLLSADERANLIVNRVYENVALYADMYGVPVGEFYSAFERSI